MPDPYEIIGVRRDASLDEIRIAYRRSAQVLHPDRFATAGDGVQSEAAHRMLQLNAAMEEIEDERADEASGTGTLGHVTFGDGMAAGATHPPARPPADAAAARANPPAADAPVPPAAAPAPPLPPERPRESDVAVAAAEASAGEELVFVLATPTTRTPAETPAPRAPEPVAAAPASETPSHSYGLGAENTFGYDADDDDDDDDLPPPRQSYQRPSRSSGGPGRVRLAIAGVVIVAALAAIAGYLVLRGGGTSDRTFTRATAPFSFDYPKDFHARRLDGGIALNRPTYQVGFGIDAMNYLLASTYKLGFTVQNDGSATGPKGQKLTPGQIDHDVDVTIAKLATQAGFARKGVRSGSLGRLRARIYDYAKADGSLASTFVVALQGHTEYYVTCQSTPQGEQRITRACDKLLASFAPA